MNNQIKSNHEEKEFIYLRSYSKVIFFYPLFIVSIVLWILELINGKEVPWFGFFWLILFFINLFIIAFDTSSTKFFIFVLLIVILVLIYIFAIMPNFNLPFSELMSEETKITMSTEFYLCVTIILGLNLFIAWIGTRFNFWKLERNEAYHKQGIFQTATRYPVKSLRLKKEIPDIFEFLLLRAGSITLYFGKDQSAHLKTVLNISKKAKQIDALLSEMEVEVEEIDGK
ncbi:MAG: hypothetical protein ACFFAQ_15490 [Promethearchaeota archaeon]